MKAKSYLSVISYTENNQGRSIQESVNWMVDILSCLKNRFSEFSDPIYYHSNKNIPIDLELGKSDIVEIIANQILNKEWNEITKFEGNNKPTISYRRQIGKGFSGWFSYFNSSGQLLFDCSIGMGYQTNGIVITPKSRETLFEYSFYEDIAEELSTAMDFQYCTVRVSIPSVAEIYKEFDIKYPLGWLTYYSDELGIKVPELMNVSIEPFHKGTLIKTDDIDFLADKESFDAYKSRLRVLLEKFIDANSIDT